jgi:hypothetical protein
MDLVRFVHLELTHQDLGDVAADVVGDTTVRELTVFWPEAAGGARQVWE